MSASKPTRRLSPTSVRGFNSPSKTSPIVQNCGKLESSARRFSKTSKGPWVDGSLKIDPCSEADLESHNADRRQICEDLAGSIRIRCFTALDDNTVKQFSVLDPRRWPKKDAGALLSHGNVQISQLIHTYRAFFQNPNGTSVPGEVVLTQWKQMKKLMCPMLPCQG